MCSTVAKRHSSRHEIRLSPARFDARDATGGDLLPAILRFLLFVAVIAGLIWGGMIALVTFVEPQPREMTQTIPASRLNK